jgi:hypothetical protein
MSYIPTEIPVHFSTRVIISDADTNEVLVDKSNAIHRQNMALILARALAGQANGSIYRIAFGDGGTFRDAAGNLVYRSPNDGRSGGWEDRLYHETYSEILQAGPLLGTDPGSADGDTVRPGGGSDPSMDPIGSGLSSQEVGTKSNVIAVAYLNQNEPKGQGNSPLGPDVVDNPDERCFLFDELGLFSYGAPATSTYGYSGIGTGFATSKSSTLLQPNTRYDIVLSVNEDNPSDPNAPVISCTIQTPAGGSGDRSEITFGDLCQGINDGSWIVSGDQIEQEVFVYITDDSEGAYPSIIGRQSYGHLIFQSKMRGVGSNVFLKCTQSNSNLFYALNGSSCDSLNTNYTAGKNAGVANDPTQPEMERERLLTHMIFDPILKTAQRSLKIVYILTVSVAQTTDSRVSVVQ